MALADSTEIHKLDREIRIAIPDRSDSPTKCGEGGDEARSETQSQNPLSQALDRRLATDIFVVCPARAPRCDPKAEGTHGGTNSC